MDVYEQLSADSLIDLFYEKVKNIESGLLTENSYYELGLMISAASKKGITLGKTDNSKEECSLARFVPLTNSETKDVSVNSCKL